MTMNKATDIGDIANWFLSKESMTHKKLQKVCYYAVAWGWALMDKNISSNSEFQAWVHGPVSPVLYSAYKGVGWNLIPKPTDTVELPQDIADLLESVWLTYGEKSGNELEALSHAEKPWVEARNGLAASERSEQPIDTNTMKDFYNSIKSTDF